MTALPIVRRFLAGHLTMLRSSGGRTLLSNSGWSLFNQIARVASLAAVMIALSRHFDPQIFGSLACGLAFVRVFAVVASFGLDRVIVRQLIERREESGAIIRKAFFVKLSVAAVSYGAMIALLLAIDYQDRLTLSIAILAGAGLLFQCCDVFEYAFQAENRFRSVFLGRGLPVLAFAAVKIAAILLGVPLLAIAALESLEAGVVGLVLVMIYQHPRWNWHSQALKSGPTARRLIAEGLPLVLGTLAVMIYMRTDVLMLGKMSGYMAAGIYAAAAQITEACALAPMAFLPVLFPMIVRWRGAGVAIYEARLEKIFFWAVLAAICISIGLTIAAPALVPLLYGVAYLPSAKILMIHAWCVVFIFLSIIQIGYDIAEGLTWFATARTAAGALMNVGINLILIPRYGPIGSAVATVCSQSCTSFLFNLLHPRTRPIFVMQLKALFLVPLFCRLADFSPRSARNALTRGRSELTIFAAMD